MKAARARALLKSLAGKRVLVLGDVMLDEFIWGKVRRISPEAPVPVVEVTSQSFHLGGAANVAANLQALGGLAVLAGIVGDDPAAEHVREGLSRAGVTAHLVAGEAGRPTTLKTRIVAHGQQVVRADREVAAEIRRDLETALRDRVRRELPRCQVLVFSDYEKGVITSRLAKDVLALAKRRGIPVLVDPKVRHLARYRGVSVITPNRGEAEQATGMSLHDESGVAAAGRRLLQSLACQAVLITRGEQGMSLCERGQAPVHIPAAAREVYDVTGAGDTVIAAMALALAAGASLGEAAALANLAAGVVVGKLGTAQASPAEILAALEQPRS